MWVSCIDRIDENIADLKVYHNSSVNNIYKHGRYY